MRTDCISLSAVMKENIRSGLNEFHCQQKMSLTILTLSGFSRCSFLLPRILPESCHFFKVLLNEVFPFTTSSNFCLPLFLENFAINTGLVSAPLWFCFVSSYITHIRLGPTWVCELLQGNVALLTFIAYLFSFFLSSDSPSVHNHSLISLLLIISLFYCPTTPSLFLFPGFSKE